MLDLKLSQINSPIFEYLQHEYLHIYNSAVFVMLASCFTCGLRPLLTTVLMCKMLVQKQECIKNLKSTNYITLHRIICKIFYSKNEYDAIKYHALKNAGKQGKLIPRNV